MSHVAVIEALAKELYDVIEKYADALPMASVIGALETIKHDILTTSMEEDNDE